MKSKVSDIVARFFARKGITHGFGIIGSANSHLFDSFFNTTPEIELVCNHHEQACTMAVQTYWKITGTPTFALVTAGAGSSNAITGVLSAWADSIPCLILSGQENARYITPDHALRMYGIQGYDSPFAVSKMTKYGARVMDPRQVLFELEKAWHFATTGRPGPCWLDFPMNVQGAFVEEDDLPRFSPPAPTPEAAPLTGNALVAEVKKALTHLAAAERPLLWLGVGITMAGAREKILPLLEQLGVPALVTWSAVDLLPSEHPLVVGRAGTYGQRAANLILQNCDYLLAIGTRLAIPQVGYEVAELARAAKHITVVDIDPTELRKYPQRFNHPVHADAGEFIRTLQAAAPARPTPAHASWVARCQATRARFPWIGSEHADQRGFMNTYRFMEKLGPHMKPDQVIVTDMGTALLCGHQALAIKPPQRLLTSQGLGEMGFGLPGAIGASFARNRGEVMCLNCDGGMMMNLQELQTVVHHRLPIKLFIFNNDGYLMIKHTQKAIMDGRYSGTDRKSGVSCPDFTKLAAAFDLPAWQIRTWEDFDRVLPLAQAATDPCIVEVFMDPEQYFHPKLSLAKQADGTLVSPPLEDLSPLLPRTVLREEMGGTLHPKSEHLA
ncbi:thiamine pyrophosphate-binding protein [Oleiharenicola lentus]|uniref:Thiamine pyrophosphate-binding protein n=1 Tax=Oleiharenicola lentus TaxID=2508720 RepID=A0A4Q1CA21_9BACT|nr:thiamine pyrophosphate-binding protein [Oleiharenicola lentus]RXK55691.1 thiamine pyrophosphate-binding protein [Oleiharenicola lentus]